ncbi:dihydrofolate reductase family protein [Isoptericola halotolerans]|uniref:dihydrofolate reductase family protein n=1 Tax=Isoptericola halotolerans TaxID=300560 RepID=UPI00388DDB5B
MSSDTPSLRLLLPSPEALPADPAERRLVELCTPPAGRHVRANMVASVDGGAWGEDGRSGSINDAADWRIFRVLRALADVVLVGAGTARAEAYTALERPRGLATLRDRPLELALVTRSGRVPDTLLAGGRPPWVVTGSAGAATAAAAVGRERVVEADDGGAVDLAAGTAGLAERGMAHVLCEGGPHLLAAMLAADLVDELCLTTTPQLVGPGPGRVVAGLPDVAAPAGPVGPAEHVPTAGRRPARLGHLLAAPSGTLVARWELRP